MIKFLKRLSRLIYLVKLNLWKIENRDKIDERLKCRFKALNVKLGETILISEDSYVGNFSSLGDFSILKSSSIGRHTYLANNTEIHNTVIGNYCSIAPYAIIGLARHPTELVSTHPSFFNPDHKSLSKHYCSTKIFDDSVPKTIIEADVWIGMRTTIIGGINIGVGSVVAAGSIVTKDVEPYSIVGGNPAKLIRKRFNDQVIEDLMQIRWWEWDDSAIEKYSTSFHKPETLINAYRSDPNNPSGY